MILRAENIKKSYKSLAMKWHPDRNKDDKDNAEEKFKEISEAYSILSDAAKKAKYDRGGTTIEDLFGSEGFSRENPFDIFQQFFGQGGQNPFHQRRTRRGRDLKIKLSLTLEECYFGLEKNIKLRKTK